MITEKSVPEKKVEAIPFLKWAGGKRWLVSNHADLFPKKYNYYVEPFLGSGAVFFHLRPKNAILSDLNQDLISSYLALKDDWLSVSKLLNSYHRVHSEEFYYKMRASTPKISSRKAARFIYLNRTCWNGLYRVNLNGTFNVPIGTKTNVTLDTDDFRSISTLLQRAELNVVDFEHTIERALKNDFLFVDPPYTVKHNNNGFIKYNETLFTWSDQIRLRDAVIRAKERGAKVLVTNANHRSVRDLYKGVGELISLKRNSVISGLSTYRDKCTELIVKCY